MSTPYDPGHGPSPHGEASAPGRHRPPPQTYHPGHQQYGQSGPAAAPYGGHPQPHGAPYGYRYPQGGWAPPPLIPRPRAHRSLLTLTLISAGIYVVTALVGLVKVLTLDVTAELRRTGFRGMSPEEQHMAEGMVTRMSGSMRPLMIVMTVVIMAAVCFLYWLVYSHLAKVREWARVLGIVFASLSVLNLALSFFGLGSYGGLVIVVTLLYLAKIVVDVLWIVTACKAPVPQYFRDAKYAPVRT